MEVYTEPVQTGLNTSVPLVECKAWPLQVLKDEVKAEISEWSHRNHTEDDSEFFIKQEVVDEDDPLADRSNHNIEKSVKSEVKDEISEQCLDSAEMEEEKVLVIQELIEVEEEIKIENDVGTSDSKSLVFSCSKCGKTYSSPLYLENHSKLCRGGKKAPIQVAAEEVPTDLQSLAKIVDGKKMYFCQYCEYKSHRSDHIKQHLVTHSGDKKYKCGICDKTFTLLNSLTRHELIHAGAKTYKCTECSFACNRASDLRRHFTVHSGEKTFACKFCKYTTCFNNNLVYHMRTHTGDKPYKCEQCEYKTTCSSHLKIHVQAVHTREKPFTCLHCDYKTTHKSSLIRHMKHKHKQT